MYPNNYRTDSRARLGDDDVLEILDWRPELSTWCQDYLEVNDRRPDMGFRSPCCEWVDWVRAILFRVPLDADGYEAIAGILIAAEVLQPQGMQRTRLADALLALGRLGGQKYQPAGCRVDHAERNGVIRSERIDLWRPGMASGTGWRTYCRLTLYGKSLVQTDAMPEPFPPPPEQADPFSTAYPISPPVTCRDPSRTPLAEPLVPQKPEPAADPTPLCPIPNDYSWAGPFVDQQVRKFFGKHKHEYTQAVRAVLDGQVELDQFGLEFGPKRISVWINQALGVGDDHPRPCLKQHINASATYETLVKAFKRNPDDHAVVQRLRHGRSDEAQAILDAFLVDGEWEEAEVKADEVPACTTEAYAGERGS